MPMNLGWRSLMQPQPNPTLKFSNSFHIMRILYTFFFLACILHLLFLSTNAHCIEKEKLALLDFKLSFVADPMGYLSTWSIDNVDCCQWNGVECASTGHVTSLDFFEGFLESFKLRSSLLELEHLTMLSFYGNHLTMRIPKFFGSLSNLTYLDLSDGGFFGEIPPHLGNLSMLQHLDLSGNGLHADNSKWLSRLSLIEYLDFKGVDLSNAIDLSSTLKMLPTLSTFLCESCSLPQPPLSSLSLANLSTSLRTLDLSDNNLSSSTFSYLINGANNLEEVVFRCMNLENNLHEFLEALIRNARYSLEKLNLAANNLNKLPSKVFMFPSLTSLQLSNNSLTGLHLQGLLTLSSLEILDVSLNRISGNIEDFVQYLPKNLTRLDVSFNRISGNLQDILQYFPANLTLLDLSSNLLNGIISDARFSKFPYLQHLKLSGNNFLAFNFSKSWVPTFQLNTLEFASCKVGPSFPHWILTQKYLEYLDISNSMISDAIPDAFWNFSTRLISLNLSHNNISCILPSSNLSFSSDYFLYLDMSYNSFHGPIPLFLFTAPMVDLSNNKFSSFPALHGRLSSDSPYLISLSNNNLSGSVPNWIFQFDELLVLDLENNVLSGTLPEAIGSLWRLSALHLNNNRFSGQLPTSLKNCTHLAILELENNKFYGPVPFWIGESMTQLIVLTLSSNNFSGNMPSSLCHLQSLQVLDFSYNKISGSIPSCVYNFTAMFIDKDKDMDQGSSDEIVQNYFYTSGFTTLLDGASIMWKGALTKLNSRNLLQRNIINLSNNDLTGQIPIELMTLKQLRSLDLTRNVLNGSIPNNIGQLTSLEVLKLSSNRLDGEIPESLASLTFLNTLNLSYNNLSGRIPSSTQLQSFDPSSYAGNPKLCGKPLPTKCPGDEDYREQPPMSEEAQNEDDESFDILAFLAAFGPGFATSFLGVVGILHFNRQPRLAFFRLVNDIVDSIFVRTSLFQSRIKRSICFPEANEGANM